MVEILCPHCEGEIELDDDASGEFECPLCDGEFEWNVEEDEKLRITKEAHQNMIDAVTQTDNRIIPSHGFNKMHPVAKVAVGAAVGYNVVLTIITLIFVIFLVFLLLIYLLFGPVMNGSFFA
ncbi:MAG: hypothetical protein ISP82_06070 [Candidatus Poseidoniaceae archaeon]|nr:hypothetical protein [Candidatus Poseidoniaceae archaeon]